MSPCPPALVLERLRAFWCQICSAVAVACVEGPNALLCSDRDDSKNGCLVCVVRNTKWEPTHAQGVRRERRATGVAREHAQKRLVIISVKW